MRVPSSARFVITTSADETPYLKTPTNRFSNYVFLGIIVPSEVFATDHAVIRQ